MFTRLSSQPRQALYVGIVVTFIFSIIGIADLPPASAQQAWTPTPAGVSLTPTSDVSPQIIGGQPATPGEWPWQVALVLRSASDTELAVYDFCGGTLIAAQWVLTAAHCVDELLISEFDVVAGIWNLASPASGYQRRHVINSIIHNNYNGVTNDYDIALLKLASPITIGYSGETKTSLILIPDPTWPDLAGNGAWATGWGSRTGGEEYPEELYEAKLTIISNTNCNNASHWNGKITQNMLCAGPLDGSRIGPCFGDSGGPLAVDFGTGLWDLIGISSFVNGNCDNNARYPVVFTKVQNFAPWINAYVPSRQLVFVGNLLHGRYGLTKNQSTRVNYAVNNGPVQISSHQDPIIASMRVAYHNGSAWTSFSEMMGFPHVQVTRTYMFPWYDNVNHDSQLRIANIGAAAATVTVTVAGEIKGSYVVGPWASRRISYLGLQGGPVVVHSPNGTILASMRVAYHDGNAWTSFSEMMGLPASHLTDTYVFPWYNNADLDSELRFGNVGNVNTTVTLSVAGLEQDIFVLAPNQSVRVSYPGSDGGPVVIKSSGGVPIIASLRVAYTPNDGLTWTSFSEMMGLPKPQLTDTYYLPWYNNVNLDSQLRFGNVGNVSTTVTVTIGGIVRGNYVLAPNRSFRVKYSGLDGGPIIIKSSGGTPILASERVAYYNGSAWTSFSEMMGLPKQQLTSVYDFPWYNNVDLDSQIRFGVP